MCGSKHQALGTVGASWAPGSLWLRTSLAISDVDFSMHFGSSGFGPQYGPSDSKALHMEEWWGPHPPLPSEVHVKSGPMLLGSLPTTFLCGPKSSPRKPTTSYGNKTSNRPMEM